LFKTENPYDIPEGTPSSPDAWLVNLNENSLYTFEAYVDPSVLGLDVFDKVQFERHGYYCVDLDSTPERMVLTELFHSKNPNGKDKTNKAMVRGIK
jgi:glutaminyl-tRNA synthetase